MNISTLVFVHPPVVLLVMRLVDWCIFNLNDTNKGAYPVMQVGPCSIPYNCALLFHP